MSRLPSPNSIESIDTVRNRRFAKYLLVGALGVAINQGTLYLATGLVGLSYLLGGFLGQAVSLSINYAINDAWTWDEFGSSGIRPWLWRGLKYGATRAVGVGIHLVALTALVELFQLHYLIANLVAIGVGTAWGFGASDTVVWQTDDSSSLTARLQSLWAPVDRRFTTHTQQILALTVIAFAGFTVYMVLLYRNFWMLGADFGSYIHMFETLREGTSFLHTGRYRVGNPSSSYWGEHFSLTLLVVYPIYWLFPHAETLIVVKSACLALSIPALWVVAREHLSVRLSKILVLSYVLNPFLYRAWVSHFQEQMVLPVLVFGAYYCYLKQYHKLFLASIAAILVTNEFLVFIIGGATAGFIIATYRSERRSVRDEWAVFAGMAILVVGTHLLAGNVISQYNQFSGIPLRSIAEPFHPYLDGQRATTGRLLSYLLGSPTLVWESITAHIVEKAIYLTILFVPVAFLSLFDELTLTSFAPFVGFAWLFSGQEVYYTFGLHYPLYLIAFLYIGAIRVAGRNTFTGDSRRLVTRIFVAILLLNVLAGVAFTAGNATPQQTEHRETVVAGLETVPDSASLVTQNDIYPHAADRPNALFVASTETYNQYKSLHGVDQPQYIVFDTKLDIHDADWARVVQQVYQEQLGEEYGLYRYEEGVWIFKRGYDSDTKGITRQYRPPQHTYDPTDLSLSNGVLQDDMIKSTQGRVNDAVWFGPHEPLPEGTYNITFRVNIEETVKLDVLKDLEPVAATEVSNTDGWENVTLTITLDEYAQNLEYRGIRRTSNGTVAVKYVTVEPVERSSS